MTAGRRHALNYALYQVGWLACVGGVAHGRPAAGAAVAAALVAVHLLLARSRGVELRLMTAAAVLGAGVESSLVQLDLVDHRPFGDAASAAPAWIVVLWIQLATLLRFCLAWLTVRPRLATLLGALGGPLAFWAGERWGAVRFPDPVAATVALAVAWAICLPALGHLAARWGEGRPAGDYRWPG